MNNIYKHGLPGIGVTGQQGKKGKSGNSIYFGTFDSFFSYIDVSAFKNSSIDYDDKDYDITYAKDEYRLDPKYNEGDLLYILNSSLENSSIDYVIEITEDLTTCTSTQLANKITYRKPFTVNKNKFNRLNIVGAGMDSATTHGMFIANELYNNYPINVKYVIDNNNKKPEKITDLTDQNIDVADEPFIIPERYSDAKEAYIYLNNGKEINKYKYELNTGKKVLLNLNYNSRLFEIQSYLNSNMCINTYDINLYIDNLHIRNNNKGNIKFISNYENQRQYTKEFNKEE